MNTRHLVGYTIIEALMFIAVSSLIFFSAMNAIGGRQQQVQFTQSVRTFDSQLRDYMNDVSTGFFPGLGGISCNISPNLSPSSTDRPALTAEPGVSQGESDNCIFVGKVLQFSPGDDIGSSAPDFMNIYTLLGRKTLLDSGARRTVTSIAEANPAVAIIPGDDASLDLTQRVELDWGLRVNRVVAPGIAGNDDFGAIGFFTTFGTTGGANGVLSSSQAVDLAAVTSIEAGASKDTAIDQIALLTDQDEPSESQVPFNPAGGVVLCLSNPDGNRQAAITISSENRSLATEVTFDQVDAAVCG